MDFGFNIPNSGTLAVHDAIKSMVQSGENLGFKIIAIPDHIVIPRKIRSAYPYSASGHTKFFDHGETLEALTLMASISSMTKSAKLLSSVLIFPCREPILTAKMLTTIDIMSRGRLIVGCGVGWMEDEFIAVGSSNFANRGKVTDEYINALREMWTKEEPSFTGKYVNIDNIYFRPKAIQAPHPPIWIGGDSKVAMKRAARLGDGWYPVGLNPETPINTVGCFANQIKQLHKLTERYGRNPAEIEISFWPMWYRENKSSALSDGTRHLLLGSTNQTVDDIGKLAELGVKSIVFNFIKPEISQTLDDMESFALNVISQFQT